jgi:hypothetical protein
MGGEPTALSARPCRQPDNKRSTFDYRRHWKASRTSLRRRSTRRPKAQLPPCLTAPVDPLHSQNGGHFVLSWVVPTRRTYPSPFTMTVPVGNCLIKTDQPVDGATKAKLSSGSARSLRWNGEIPPQKWMNFYARVLSKFATGNGLRVTVTVDIAPDGGVSEQKVEETRSALRELGLNDMLDKDA